MLVPANVEVELLKAGIRPEDTILAEGIQRRKEKEIEFKERKR